MIPADPAPPIPTLETEVTERLARGSAGAGRLNHVRSVVTTVRLLAGAGGWPERTARAATRAAWLHDALKLDGVEAWRERILSAGEEPDPWAEAHDPSLLHAQAAALWAAARGETDPGVLSAVRHHPTGHPAWAVVGRLLYVADFAEPTRAHAERFGSASILADAGKGQAGLARAARRVLALRIEQLLEKGRQIHPDSWLSWNAWAGIVP